MDAGRFPARFIPTPVGNTQSRLRGDPQAAVHPHACGEHSTAPPPTEVSTGSSPRLWGTRHGRTTNWSVARFIPTPVGNTLEVYRAWAGLAVHPHACGEHVRLRAKVFQLLGSSPRLWGTQLVQTSGVGHIRFIPTPVGNTLLHLCLALLQAVHPHACGEHTARASVSEQLVGSSPRLWGTRLQCRQWYGYQSVHPHACGEHPS